MKKYINKIYKPKYQNKETKNSKIKCMEKFTKVWCILSVIIEIRINLKSFIAICYKCYVFVLPPQGNCVGALYLFFIGYKYMSIDT